MTASVREQLLALVLAAREDVRTCRVELGHAPTPLQRAPQPAPQAVPASPAPAPAPAPAPQPVLRVTTVRSRV